MNDTPLSIEKILAQKIGSKTPTERLLMASSMFDAAKKLIEAGLRNENGSLTDCQLRALLFLRLYSEYYTPDEIKRIVTIIPRMQLNTDGICFFSESE